MNYDKYKSMAEAALGRKRASLVLKNAKVINVFSEEILIQDIAIDDGMIVGVGDYHGDEEIDLCGKYAAPGFIDAHLHFESTLVTPSELVQAASGWGTTTFIVDPHEVANVAGTDGIDYIIDQISELDANVFIMLPSCVPAAQHEENGCVFTAEQMKKYLNNPNVLGLGELMDYRSVTEAEPEMIAKLKLFSNRPKDGHAPRLSEKQLAAYALSKIKTDHECTEYDYALQEVRNGMQVLIREGSGSKNLEAIVGGIVKSGMDTTRFSFCTDDKHIEDIQRQGHISYNIKKSIALGIAPIKAIKMATINTAVCYGLSELGAIAPGYRADIVVLNDLELIDIHSVYCKGRKQDFVHKIKAGPCPESLKNTVHIAPLSIEDIQIKTDDRSEASVIEIIGGEIVTRHIKAKLPAKNGVFEADSAYNKAIVVERHKATGHCGVAAVSGFNIHKGAIATSVSHDSHNLIAIGDNDTSLLLAIEELHRMQGGYVAISGDTVLEAMPLPIMGLMSDTDPECVGLAIKRMIAHAHELGVPNNVEPFVTLSFLALPVIPELRITTRGLLDLVN